jgi:hypothetical protein
MEKHELELVTSTCTMSCNVLLHVFTRHIMVEWGYWSTPIYIDTASTFRYHMGTNCCMTYDV